MNDDTVKAPIADLADFAALDPFFRIIEQGLATGAEGTKVPVGLWDSSTENKTFSSRRYWPTWSGAA